MSQQDHLDHLEEHHAWNVRTSGAVPYVLEPNQLIVVDGSIRGNMFPEIIGEPYLYDKFPWSTVFNDGYVPSEQECIDMAHKNDSPQLWFEGDTYKKVKLLLEN